MRFDKLARKCQAEPHAAWLGRNEGLEQVLGHNLGHAGPVVLDLDPHPLVRSCYANRDAPRRAARFRSGIDGVVDHVDQRLLQLQGINSDWR